jgi:phage shock protein E
MRRTLYLLATLFAIACAGSGTSGGTMSQTTLLDRLDDPDAPLVLDVRTPDEYHRGHVPGAINIPYLQVGARLTELGAVNGRDVVVYCEAGPRAQRAEATLKQAGFERVYHLEGDMAAWRQSRMPVEAR